MHKYHSEEEVIKKKTSTRLKHNIFIIMTIIIIISCALQLKIVAVWVSSSVGGHRLVARRMINAVNSRDILRRVFPRLLYAISECAYTRIAMVFYYYLCVALFTRQISLIINDESSRVLMVVASVLCMLGVFVKDEV